MNIPRAMVGPPSGTTPTVDGLPLTVSAVARQVGVAPATLRTWDRRYGVGPRDHSSGGDRRYTTRDVLRVGLMQHFLAHGAVPAEAARLALAVSTEAAVPVGDPVPAASDGAA